MRIRTVSLWLGTSLLLYVALHINWRASQPSFHQTPIARQVSSTQYPLQVSSTGLSWGGHPVYRVLNQTSGTLYHATFMNVSGDLLPVLVIGSASAVTRLNQLPHQPLPGPPFTLHHGEAAYVVDAKSVPVEITVLWETALGEVYENVDS